MPKEEREAYARIDKILDRLCRDGVPTAVLRSPTTCPAPRGWTLIPAGREHLWAGLPLAVREAVDDVRRLG